MCSCDTDKDGDGLTALVEILELLTDPNNADSDSDGLNDGVETKTGTYVDVLNTGTDPRKEDTDGDGIGNNQDDDDDGNCDKFENVNSSAVSDVRSMGEAAFYINMDFTEYDGSEIFYIQFEIGDVEKTGKLRACNDAEGKTFCVREAQLGSSSDDNSYLQYMWLVLAAMLVSLLLYLTRRPGRRVSAPF